MAAAVSSISDTLSEEVLKAMGFSKDAIQLYQIKIKEKNYAAAVMALFDDCKAKLQKYFTESFEKMFDYKFLGLTEESFHGVDALQSGQSDLDKKQAWALRLWGICANSHINFMHYVVANKNNAQGQQAVNYLANVVAQALAAPAVAAPAAAVASVAAPAAVPAPAAAVASVAAPAAVPAPAAPLESLVRDYQKTLSAGLSDDHPAHSLMRDNPLHAYCLAVLFTALNGSLLAAPVRDAGAQFARNALLKTVRVIRQDPGAQTAFNNAIVFGDYMGGRYPGAAARRPLQLENDGIAVRA